jgi:uncharacterized protein (DUF983 family)
MQSLKKKTLWRGICGRCPNCGESKLFDGYIDQINTCPNCQENIGAIRADDGPAWLTILITGHIAAPFIAYFALHDTLPYWQAMIFLLALVLMTAFILLPRAKGLFIAGIWLMSKSK